MKKKNFNKKLMLNKETVAHLDPQKMDELRGGNTTMVCVITGLSDYVSCHNTQCDQYTCPVDCK